MQVRILLFICELLMDYWVGSQVAGLLCRIVLL